VFIRAPVVSKADPGVQVLSEYEDRIVAVQQDRLLATAFHPELTGDTRVHEYFLSLCQKPSSGSSTG
jgi:5'-phosphate synthase pdxT subunit